MPIQRRPPVNDSSMIASAGVDAGANVAEVEFKTNGAVYRIEGIQPSVVDGMLAAPSAGQYYNQHIKGKYSAIKIG